MITPRGERFSIFITELLNASPACNAPEALALLAKTLNAVEDRYSGVPYQPEQWQSDGRMYPPQRDSRRTATGFDGLHRYRSRGHNTWIDANGAIRITQLNGTVILDKPGADGRKVRS